LLHDERYLKKADLLMLLHNPVSIALKDIFDGHDMKKNYKGFITVKTAGVGDDNRIYLSLK
jgi:hypothetical protein